MMSTKTQLDDSELLFLRNQDFRTLGKYYLSIKKEIAKETKKTKNDSSEIDQLFLEKVIKKPKE